MEYFEFCELKVEKKLIFLLFYFLLAELLFAANPDRIMVLKKTDSAIKIDGIIESAWNEADSEDEFFSSIPLFW